MVRALNTRTNQTKGLVVKAGVNAVKGECKSGGGPEGLCEAWNNPAEYGKDGMCTLSLIIESGTLYLAFLPICCFVCSSPYVRSFVQSK